MKYIVKYIVTLFVALMGIFATALGQVQLPLTNPSFENGTVGWIFRPDTFVMNGNAAWGVNWAILGATTNKGAVLARNIPVQYGVTYSVQVAMKAFHTNTATGGRIATIDLYQPWVTGYPNYIRPTVRFQQNIPADGQWHYTTLSLMITNGTPKLNLDIQGACLGIDIVPLSEGISGN